MSLFHEFLKQFPIALGVLFSFSKALLFLQLEAVGTIIIHTSPSCHRQVLLNQALHEGTHLQILWGVSLAHGLGGATDAQSLLCLASAPSFTPNDKHTAQNETDSCL